MSLSKKNSQEFGQNMAAFRPMTPFKVQMECKKPSLEWKKEKSRN